MNGHYSLTRCFLYIALLLIPLAGFAAEPIVLDDKNDDGGIRGKWVDYLIDRENRLTISEISSPEFSSRFISGKAEDVIHNKEGKGIIYWTRITVDIRSKRNKPYLIELFDFRILDLEIYLPKSDGSFNMLKSGSIYPFYERNYRHKNFVFDFPYESGKPQTIYCKINAPYKVSLIGTIRSNEAFTKYATTEYFYLALYYGIIAAMALYNLFLFTSLKDKTYLYYVFYVLSIGVYSLAGDGLGFEFLWYDYPSFNRPVSEIANYFLILFALLYARSFLNTRSNAPFLDMVIVGVLLARTLLFVLWVINPKYNFHIGLDLIPLTLIYVAGIICWWNGYKTARFYVLAFSLFFAGFLLSGLQLLGVLKATVYTVYSLNFGILSEMIILSLALADRIKILTVEKEKAQQEILIQYKEKEMLKDNINKELEEKVKERTRELEEKNKELDNFVYRSSHDIKGPLKSIIGLTTVGLKDIKDPEALVYFEHILKSSRRLDSVVHHLLTVTAIKESKLEIGRIDLEKLITDIVSDFQHYSDSKDVKINIRVKQDHAFYSNEKLLYSVVQNMVENGIKYRNPRKSDSFLIINAEVNGPAASLEFKDNGLGIDPVSQEKIFDMFYKVNPNSSGSGLGLYMVKTYIEKLDGTLQLESAEGIGTTFKLNLKNNLNIPFYQ